MKNSVFTALTGSIVRVTLGLLNASALIYYTYGVRRAFGKSAALWFVMLQSSQFHVWYYASRTLPNMFAFALSPSPVTYREFH